MQAQFWIFLFPLFSLGSGVLQAGTSEWVSKTVQATQAIARGDNTGALYSALPSYNVPAGPGNVNLGAGGAHYYQPLVPYRNVGPVGYGAGYNAGANVGLNGRPKLSNTVGAGGGHGPFNVNASYSKDV